MARYEPYLDGLFTYCLSVLCEHDAATDVLGEVLALAERQPAGPRPDAASLRGLAVRAGPLGLPAPAGRAHEQQRREAAERSPRRPPPERSSDACPRPAERRRRRTGRARLAGGRGHHARAARGAGARRPPRLPRRTELAAVLGTLPAPPASSLLSRAACEVERTRAALAVVETGGCPSVSRLTGDGPGAAVHRPAPRAGPPRRRLPAAAAASPNASWPAAPWPGSGVRRHGRAPAGRRAPHRRPRRRCSAPARRRVAGTGPRFDRTGFPMDPKDRAARRDRLRGRAVTTTVVATVVAAPVLALWAAYRGAPRTGEPVGGRHPHLRERVRDPAAASAAARCRVRERRRTPPAPERPPDFACTGTDADVSVEVISSGPAGDRPDREPGPAAPAG